MNRFTKEQIQEYSDAFTMFDKEDRGFITSPELREMLKTIGMNPTDDILEQMTILVDKDGNGVIDFKEFMNLLDNLETEEKADKEARAAFNAFDVTGRGYIPSQDIKAAMSFVLEKLTPEEKDDVYRHFKLSPNRKVFFKEFKDMITLKR